MASKWAPRAISETSFPPWARKAARLPPVPPAPNTKYFISASLLEHFPVQYSMEPPRKCFPGAPDRTVYFVSPLETAEKKN